MKQIQTFTIAIFLISILIGGCSNQNTPPETEIETAVETEIVETTEPVVIFTEAPTEPEPTVPENSLGIEAGSYLKRYNCTSTGDYLDYYLHVPQNAVKGMPLVIFLHGDGEVGDLDILENFGPIEVARELYGEEFPFISLSPGTRIESWITNDIPKTLMALIDWVVKTYEIDSEHVIITGHSRGAIGVWKMISDYGDFFSAAIPISSPHATGNIYYDNCAKVPVWTFAGDVGEREVWYHQYLQQNVDQINARGGWAQFTILEGLEHGPTKTAAFTQETFDWMLSQ